MKKGAGVRPSKRRDPWFFLGILLALVGVLFYVLMGVQHQGWTDVGVYSLAVTLVGFGVVGALVSRAQDAESP